MVIVPQICRVDRQQRGQTGSLIEDAELAPTVAPQGEMIRIACTSVPYLSDALDTLELALRSELSVNQ
jgi:hypothetical protein